MYCFTIYQWLRGCTFMKYLKDIFNFVLKLWRNASLLTDHFFILAKLNMSSVDILKKNTYLHFFILLSSIVYMDTKIVSTAVLQRVGLMQKSIISSLLNIMDNNHLGGNAGVVGTNRTIKPSLFYCHSQGFIRYTLQRFLKLTRILRESLLKRQFIVE